jgi:hypothetical protein
MASLDVAFEDGDYDSPLIQANYALWTFSAVSVIVTAGLALSLQKDVTNLRRAKALSVAGKVQFAIGTIITFAIYMIHSKIKFSTVYNSLSYKVQQQLYWELVVLVFIQFMQYVLIIWTLVLARNLRTDMELDA